MGAVSRTVRLPGRGRRRGKGGRGIVRLCTVCGDRLLLERGRGSRGQSWLFRGAGGGRVGNKRRLTSKCLSQEIDSERVRARVNTFERPLLSESKNIEMGDCQHLGRELTRKEGTGRQGEARVKGRGE